MKSFFFIESLLKEYVIRESDLRRKLEPGKEMDSLNFHQLREIRSSDFVVLIKNDNTRVILKNRFGTNKVSIGDSDEC